MAAYYSSDALSLFVTNYAVAIFRIYAAITARFATIVVASNSGTVFLTCARLWVPLRTIGLAEAPVGPMIAAKNAEVIIAMHFFCI